TSTELDNTGSSRTFVLQVAGALAAVALLGLTLRQVDLGRVVSLIARLGPSGLVVLVPSFCAVSLEVFAWQRAFAVLGSRQAFWHLFGVRVESEALGSTLPLGALFADALKPKLLSRRRPTPTSLGVVATAARKYLLVLAQAGYLAVGFVLGKPLLERAF